MGEDTKYLGIIHLCILFRLSAKKHSLETRVLELDN